MSDISEGPLTVLETLTTASAGVPQNTILKWCADQAGKAASEGSNKYIIIGIAVVLLICCCIYCCCSSSGVYYWNKQQTTKQETK